MRPPKDDILEVVPFLLGKCVHLAIEKHLKNGKLIMSGGEVNEHDLYSFVHSELNGFTMSHFFLTKNIKKHLIEHGRLDTNQFSRI
jgi:hypothetical protein